MRYWSQIRIGWLKILACFNTDRRVKSIVNWNLPLSNLMNTMEYWHKQISIIVALEII